MDSSAKRMLRFIRTNPVLKDGYCLLDEFYDAYCAETKCSEQEAMSCIRYLADQGFVRFGKNQHGQTVGLELEHRARHLAYFSFRDKWRFIRNSIVIPVVVAFFTTVITTELWPAVKPRLSLLLQQALQAFRQWMR